MIQKGSRFFRPTTLNELSEIVKKESDITLLGGGTSIFRTINGQNLFVPGVVVILNDIADLIKENRTERYFEFGAMMTIEEIINRSKKNINRVLLEGLKSVAPFPIRNIATIGGTIANRDVISDIIPLLLIFNAKVEVLSFNEKKKRNKWESITQYISTRSSRGLHLITRVRIPLVTPTNSIYYKSGYKYNLFSEISFSAIAEVEKDNLSSLSMAFNVGNRSIIRTRNIEAILIGKRIPIAHRDRGAIMTSIKLSLLENSELSEQHIYQMSNIILRFLEEL